MMKIYFVLFDLIKIGVVEMSYVEQMEYSSDTTCKESRLTISGGRGSSKNVENYPRTERQYGNDKKYRQNENNSAVVVAGNRQTNEEGRAQLSAEEYDWLIDSDGEPEDQELEAHYIYMAKFRSSYQKLHKTVDLPMILSH
ncbi:hypothetical protein Tco_1499872 [Tanacetum coccineum]